MRLSSLWIVGVLVSGSMVWMDWGPAEVRAEVADGGDSAEITEGDDAMETVLLTDFTDASLNGRWAVVNDNVMGGRSVGEMEFVTPENESAGSGASGASGASGGAMMTMRGSINTNGGGFASVRMALDADMLPEVYRGVRLRVRVGDDSADRPFAFRLEDDVPRRRGINFRAVLPLDAEVPTGQWQTVTLWLEDLTPTHHGNRLNPSQWAPLDPKRVARLGLILSDVVDGPYRLDIDRIEWVP